MTAAKASQSARSQGHPPWAGPTLPGVVGVRAGAVRLLGPLLIVIATIAMLVWTRDTWADCLYDFGSQLYYPWRINAGDRLYVDIAYFNGPLSQYFNTLMFACFGTSLRTLQAVNLTILIVVLVMLYRISRSLGDANSATAATLVIVLVFAFSQYVGLANYNWMCPYTHEVTHGVALAIGSVVAVGRFVQTERRRWLAMSGVLLGLAALTKAEVFAPAAGAVVLAVMLHRRRYAMNLSILLAVAIVPVVTAFGLLSHSLGGSVALRAVAGSWMWVFDRRIARLAFYRQGLGVDNLFGNLRKMFWMLAGYSVVFLCIVAAANVRRPVGIAMIALLALAASFAWPHVPWQDVARPWPVLLAGIAILSMWWSRDITWLLRGTWAALSLGLMGKMLLNARIGQYGFALAMPGAVAVVDLTLVLLPAWVAARRGDAMIARAGGIVVLGTVVAVHLWWCGTFISQDRVVVGVGADALLAPARGLEVEAARQGIDATAPGTLAVMPQGLMLNYLTRRVNPSPYVNLMPPEMTAAAPGEVLGTLQRRPPSQILAVQKDWAAGAFRLTEGEYHYGQEVAQWVQREYAPTARFALPNGPGILLLTPRVKR